MTENRRQLLVTNAILAQDIRLRSAAEEALRGSESRLRRLFEQAADGFVVVDVGGTTRAANSMAAEIVGYATNELPGRQVLDLIAPEHQRHFTGSCRDAAGIERKPHRDQKGGETVGRSHVPVAGLRPAADHHCGRCES